MSVKVNTKSLEDEILSLVSARDPEGVVIDVMLEKFAPEFSPRCIRTTLNLMRRRELIHPVRVGIRKVFWRSGKDNRGLIDLKPGDGQRAGFDETKPVRTHPRPGVMRVSMWHVRVGEKPSKPPAMGIKSGMGAMV